MHTAIKNQGLSPQEAELRGGVPSNLYQQAVPFYQVAKQIIEFTEGRTLVCANPRLVYSFLKKEFKDLGFNFQRPTVCIEKTAQRYLPEVESTSLPYLARHLKVPFADKSCAQAEALAMAAVMQRLVHLKNQQDHPPTLLAATLAKESLLPPGISKARLAQLPNAPGVYYFHDAAGRVIYVGKSVSIRQRVRSHFQIDLASPKAVEFKSAIAEINYDETGSELLALLHESDQIKAHDPVFNHALKKRFYGYCLESYPDANGYLNLKIERMAKALTPHLPVSSIEAGKGLLFNLVERYQLCQKHCGLYKSKQGCFDFVLKKCYGACIGKEPPADYNDRVLDALSRFQYPHQSFIIVERGRTPGELGVVWVNDNRYQGFGYIDEAFADSSEDLKACIAPKADNKDCQRIIRSYLANKPLGKLIVLG